MDEKDTPPGGTGRASRRWVQTGALVTSGLVAGAILVGPHIAGAQTQASTPTPAATAPADRPTGIGPGDGSGPGPGEELLAGATANRAEAAALDEVPGGTVVRVETDAQGSAYEAHVQRSDGTVVTVYIDEDFTVTSTEDGFGPGPQQVQPADAAA